MPSQVSHVGIGRSPCREVALPFRIILSLLVVLLCPQSVFATVMLYNDSLPETLSSACSSALLADVACDPLVKNLRPDFFYPPKSLTRICTDGCSEALASWMSSVRSQCGNETISGNFELDVSALYAPGSLQYLFEWACLQESGQFCGPVAALALAFSDPGVSDFNYISEIPEGAVKPNDCDSCLAARLQMQAGSPYFDGPMVAAESMYESMTSSCSIIGKPVTTTTLGYFTAEPPAPTESVCDGDTYTIQSSDDCYTISKSQGVGTAWLLSDNHLGAYCADFPTSGTLCITNKCETVTVGTNETCSAIASAANITESQLQSWNPIINAGCLNLGPMNGTELCVGAPGEKFVEPSAELPPLTPTTTAPVPTDVNQGSVKPCGRWYHVKVGDYCNLLTLKFGISLADFIFLNPNINENCTNLFAEESYCVQAVGDINTYSGRPGYNPITIDPTASFTGVPFINLPNATATSYSRPYTPLPTATGTRDDCVYYFDGDDYQYDVNGSTWDSNCVLAAFVYNVDLESFASWNVGLGNVSDPSCQFETGVRYCGSWYLPKLDPVPSSTESPTATTTSGPTAPGPTHSGQPSDCNKWDVVADGDSCASIADDNGISTDQFFAWNPAVSKDCATNFWLGSAYCVGVSGSSTATTASPTKTTSVAPTPRAPTHSGQPSDCNKWDVVSDGDSCASIASDNGISASQFFAWNPAVSTDCTTNFWLGSAYCVGVSGSSGSTTVPPSSTAASSGPSPPAEKHAGQPSNCNKWDVVADGDSCASIASDNGISASQFFAWNPAVSKDCITNFWLGYAYCVGVSG